MVFAVAPLKMPTPEYAFGIEAVPAGFVPMKFPAISGAG